ncbi:hypothetical protein Pan181_28840 [Aeoliella mucimassa]|uniref:Alpha-galactosidase n=2 Tax=Aeoliella mucimassa TaxID=2527972 RepID=A0A518APN0_9BACT|nr:hypothetical protein Pan181_28840 [Aeoliella mucimassa]
MAFDGRTLTVSTGVVLREWQITNHGLATTRVLYGNAKQWSEASPCETDCDWSLGNLGEGHLRSLSAQQDNDEGFTDDHLQVVAVFEYPTSHVAVRYVVWAYPNAPGLRTQLQLKALPGYEPAGGPWTPQIVETFTAAPLMRHRTAFGLMQGIRTTSRSGLLEEQSISPLTSTINWANGVVMGNADGGAILIKESNKHTRLSENSDLATGGFDFVGNQVAVTGAGNLPSDLSTSDFCTCWATWLVLFEGNDIDAQLAIKQFDRRRFPVDPARDIYILANTWGTEDLRPECLHAAREENVLRELESVADLGIDVLQIDDGWQTPEWTTAATAKQVQRGKEAADRFGNYPVYPEGWSRVQTRAKELGVKLGLWAAWTAPIDALESNCDAGGFEYFKLDFAHLDTKARYDGLASKARQLIEHSGYLASVNWDVTETAPRMGYFTGREYGNIYLANRKTATVRSDVQYVPHCVLRDAWHLSKYVNLNKFQVTVQNVDNVREGAPTDAGLHSHSYAVAISLMSSPIFFQETHYYEGAARDEIRNLLAIYKQHREAMYQGYVFPIGDEPDNASWTGFQNHNTETGEGYLTIFRERLNDSPQEKIQLNFLDGKQLEFVDLLTNKTWTQTVGPEGEIELTIPDSPGFLFLKYESK